MRILYVIDHLGGGGAENQFVGLVKRIAREPGCEVKCFLTEGQGVRYEELAAWGVNVVTCDKPSKGRRTLRAVRQLQTLLNEFRPDVLHTFLMYSTFIATLALKGHWRPRLFLSTEFSSPELILKEVRFTALKRMLLKWAYGHIDFLVTTSNAVREEIAKTGYVPVDHVYVINEGVDLKACAAARGPEQRPKLGLPQNKRIVTIVGSLVERKGHMFLLNAFSMIADRVQDAMLYIVGDGPFRGALELETIKLGLADRVVFTGYRTDAKRIVSASDVFCLPSLYEGMPNVVMESMALGTPVIATGQYGTLELISHNESGLLIKPGDTEGLAQCLISLLSNTELYNKVVRNALERIQGFDFSVEAEKYFQLYKEHLH